MLDTELIPPPAVVREQLARNTREARLLRSLYRLACRAAVERVEHDRAYRPAQVATDPERAVVAG